MPCNEMANEKGKTLVSRLLFYGYLQLSKELTLGRKVRGDIVIVYKVYFKDYEQKRCKLIGVLHERRRDLRGMNRVESGLRFARLAFGNLMTDKRAIVVVPKEFRQGKERWVS